MRAIHGDEEQICMRRGTFLVLWELLTRTLRDPDSFKEVTPGNYDILFHADEAEQRALHWLAGAIQRGVLDVMSDELPELVAKEKSRIMSRPK
jgi:hypothetical protein